MQVKANVTNPPSPLLTQNLERVVVLQDNAKQASHLPCVLRLRCLQEAGTPFSIVLEETPLHTCITVRCTGRGLNCPQVLKGAGALDVVQKNSEVVLFPGSWRDPVDAPNSRVCLFPTSATPYPMIPKVLLWELDVSQLPCFTVATVAVVFHPLCQLRCLSHCKDVRHILLLIESDRVLVP